ncbi:MAG: tetratricopeptide repeat protein [Bacteroidetes bacterium]|nr:tetratricopeptide repeat protein [Bacteroidota bacterium]
MRRRIKTLIFKSSNLLIITLAVSSCSTNPTPNSQLSYGNDSIPPDIRVISEKIASDRNNADLYFQRAHAYFSHNKFVDAISDMKIVLKIDSTKPEYYNFISDLYFTQNKTRDTRDALRRAIKLDSSNVEALLKYSQLFYLMRTYDTAMYYVNRSIHFDKTKAVAHFQKGMILKETGDTARAVSSFQSAVEFNQNYFEAYMQLGVLCAAKKNLLALGYFDNALKIQQQSIEAGYAKAKFLQDIKKYDDALQQYDSLLVSSPDNQDITYNIGAILFEQKKYKDALQKFDLTIKRDDNFFRGYYGRGGCFEMSGEKQKAMDDYKKCLAIKPDFEPAILQLDAIERSMRKKE